MTFEFFNKQIFLSYSAATDISGDNPADIISDIMFAPIAALQGWLPALKIILSLVSDMNGFVGKIMLR